MTDHTDRVSLSAMIWIDNIRLCIVQPKPYGLGMTKGDDVIEEIPVLVIGGSLVGLTSAMFLARHGVEVLAVERHPGTAIHPRAGHLHLRTLELMRSVDLERPLKKLSAERYFPNGCVNEVRSLRTGEVATYIPDLNGGVEEFSPSRRIFVAQDAIEPLLRAKALEYGAQLVYGSEVTVEERDACGVIACIRNLETGEERRVRAQYVVAADGNRSPVRDMLGIDMVGHGELSKSATIYFSADFRHLLGDQELGVTYVFNDDLRGFFRFEKSGLCGFLVINTFGDPRDPANLDTWPSLTHERASELVTSALGDPSIEVTIDDVALWRATANVATRYSDDRVFLVGDAAHVVPPNGGFGGNTGIQDAHNLAWKLALVVNRRADPALLKSYDEERRRVGKFTIDQAYSRYRRRTTAEFIDDAVPALVDDLSAEIGYRYFSEAMHPERPTPTADNIAVHPRDARGEPGTRAAHFWQTSDQSSLDLFGDVFVLLAGAAATDWLLAAETIATNAGLPLRAYKAHLSDADFERLYGVTPQGASLIRPDGFVCWRSTGRSAEPEQEITTALVQILGAPVRSGAYRG
jgi:2-polyprenyl-6-methoxyphenol hydroxylase-like FAD-dependent oxidoreductase